MIALNTVIVLLRPYFPPKIFLVRKKKEGETWTAGAPLFSQCQFCQIQTMCVVVATILHHLVHPTYPFNLVFVVISWITWDQCFHQHRHKDHKFAHSDVVFITITRVDENAFVLRSSSWNVAYGGSKELRGFGCLRWFSCNFRRCSRSTALEESATSHKFHRLLMKYMFPMSIWERSHHWMLFISWSDRFWEQDSPVHSIGGNRAGSDLL